MTDTSPVADTDDGSLGSLRATHHPTSGSPVKLPAVTAAQLTRALPYILVPALYVLSLIFIPGYFSKLSIISLLIRP